jgi:hypothetical protein
MFILLIFFLCFVVQLDRTLYFEYKNPGSSPGKTKFSDEKA